jgi:hypothetical protein
MAKRVFFPPWAVGPLGNFTQNRNFNIGDKIHIEWTPSVVNASMTLFQIGIHNGVGGFVTLETGIYPHPSPSP